MKKVSKHDGSEIILNGWQYPNDQANILTILKQEQQNLGAFWEKPLLESEDVHIAHFNPKLKGTEEDNYKNWYATLSKENKGMGTRNADARWEQYKDILYPYADDLEKRITFDPTDGQYITTKAKDKKAKNLILFVRLNDFDLPKERLEYLARLEDIVNQYEEPPTIVLPRYFKKFPKDCMFIRAVEVYFSVALV